MILVLDIGNTSISIGFFENDSLVKTLNIPYAKTASICFFENIFEQIAQNENITETIIASVADNVTYKIFGAAENIFKIKPVLITQEMKLGIKIKAKNPNKIGIDRIANIHEVSKMYSEPVIVADFGTATTFDITDGKKNFIGGIIMPGINTQLKSLSENTSKLEYVNLKKLENLKTTINTDTDKAILTGVVKGHARAVEGLLTDCINELKKKTILVATGGLAHIITQYIKNYQFDNIDKDITIKGLYGIYMLNKN